MNINTNALPILPFVGRNLFASQVGVSVDVVEGWIRRGYLKQVKIGRRSLVDLRPFWNGDQK